MATNLSPDLLNQFQTATKGINFSSLTPGTQSYDLGNGNSAMLHWDYSGGENGDYINPTISGYATPTNGTSGSATNYNMYDPTGAFRQNYNATGSNQGAWLPFLAAGAGALAFGGFGAGAASTSGVSGVFNPAMDSQLASSQLGITGAQGAAMADGAASTGYGLGQGISGPLGASTEATAGASGLGGGITSGQAISGASALQRILGQGAGQGGNSSGTGYGDLAGLATGAYGMNQQNQASDKMLAYLQSRQQMNDNMYAPGSPEYNALWDQMSRQDAAAGRNSQYGPRSVDLAARIAQLKMNANTQMTTGISKYIGDAYNQRANSINSVAPFIGKATAGGSQSLQDWLNTNGGGNTVINANPDTSWQYNPNATTSVDDSVNNAMQQYGVDPSLGWSA